MGGNISDNTAKVFSLTVCILWGGFIFYNSGKTGVDLYLKLTHL